MGTVIFVKMNPTDSSGVYPDLALLSKATFDDGYDISKAINENVKQGDIVSFEAKITRLGSDYMYHELELIELTFTDKSMKIEEIPMAEMPNA